MTKSILYGVTDNFKDIQWAKNVFKPLKIAKNCIFSNREKIIKAQKHILFIVHYIWVKEWLNKLGLSCAKLSSSWFQAYSPEASHGLSG